MLPSELKSLRALRDRFKLLFEDEPSPAEPTDEELELERQRSIAIRADARACTGTQFWKGARQAIQDAIEDARPDPRLGIEAIACATMRQEGLREALRIMDNMVQQVEALNE